MPQNTRRKNIRRKNIHRNFIRRKTPITIEQPSEHFKA